MKIESTLNNHSLSLFPLCRHRPWTCGRGQEAVRTWQGPADVRRAQIVPKCITLQTTSCFNWCNPEQRQEWRKTNIRLSSRSDRTSPFQAAPDLVKQPEKRKEPCISLDDPGEPSSWERGWSLSLSGVGVWIFSIPFLVLISPMSLNDGWIFFSSSGWKILG